MTDLIVTAILVLFAVIGGISAASHFKGRGGCCGGGGYRPKKKRLKRVLYTKTFTVAGMHCINCKNRVEEIVGDVPGIAGAVNLKKGILTVSYESETDDAQFLGRLEKAGYPAKPR